MKLLSTRERNAWPVLTVIHLSNQNKVIDCTIVKFYIKKLNDCLAPIEDVIFGLAVSCRVHASLRHVQTCQLQKQTDPAKTGLARCLVSKSHGSEVCNCRLQRDFFSSLGRITIAAVAAHNCSFTTKKKKTLWHPGYSDTYCKIKETLNLRTETDPKR